MRKRFPNGKEDEDNAHSQVSSEDKGRHIPFLKPSTYFIVFFHEDGKENFFHKDENGKGLELFSWVIDRDFPSSSYQGQNGNKNVNFCI